MEAFTTQTIYVPVHDGYVAVADIGDPTERIKLFMVADDGFDEPYVRALALNESDICRLMSALNDALPRYEACDI